MTVETEAGTGPARREPGWTAPAVKGRSLGQLGAEAGLPFPRPGLRSRRARREGVPLASNVWDRPTPSRRQNDAGLWSTDHSDQRQFWAVFSSSPPPRPPRPPRLPCLHGGTFDVLAPSPSCLSSPPLGAAPAALDRGSPSSRHGDLVPAFIPAMIPLFHTRLALAAAALRGDLLPAAWSEPPGRGPCCAAPLLLGSPPAPARAGHVRSRAGGERGANAKADLAALHQRSDLAARGPAAGPARQQPLVAA